MNNAGKAHQLFGEPLPKLLSGELRVPAAAKLVEARA